MTDHLIGVRGHKTKWISSTAGCRVQIITQHQREVAMIEFSSNASANIEQAIGMVEDSLQEFLSRKDSEKRLLYDLAKSAFGSHKPQRVQTPHGLLMKRFTGENSWWCMFDVPRNFEGNYDDAKYLLYHTLAEKLQDNYKIDFNENLFGNCNIDFFCGSKHTSPFVLISDDSLDDVKVAASVVAEWRDDIEHQ